jgi:hypothetical protein
MCQDGGSGFNPFVDMSANSISDPALDAILQRLRQLRSTLLRMHKAMLDAERSRYESLHGRVSSSGEMLRLVLEDPWFSWLRPISQFIITIDGVISPKEPTTLAQAEAVLEQARNLLQPSDTGSMLEQHYYDAIQRDPAVALLHGDVAQLLSAKA